MPGYLAVIREHYNLDTCQYLFILRYKEIPHFKDGGFLPGFTG